MRDGFAVALDMNRSRATALAATLLLHAVVAAWLLAARFVPPPVLVEQPRPVWLPALPARIPPPPLEPLPITLEAVEPPVLSVMEPAPASVIEQPGPDWEGAAREVARAVGGGVERRRFGPEPEKEPPQLKSKRPPPSVFERPLPRVGTTVTTPEGETILWVSDNCYIPLESMSLTMQDFHKARQGVRRCQFGVGRKKARIDLFDPVKRPPKPPPEPRPREQQEPGCRAEGGAQSCAP
jgi:hypothetical protein